jgi:hypothetical protein
MLKLFVAVSAVGKVLSLTCIVKERDPGPVGVPLITPPGDKFNPAGMEPAETVQVNAPVPPVAAKVAPTYAVPTPPPGSDGVVIVNCANAALEKHRNNPTTTRDLTRRLPTLLLTCM